LIGEISDRSVAQEFKDLLKERLSIYDEERIIDEPVSTVDQLLSQLAETDIVVATRFHNVLFALILDKPVISISFHDKCVSLLDQMGLSEYLHDINYMDAERMIEQFLDIEKNVHKLKCVIKQKTESFRGALTEQYNIIFRETPAR
jgi:polysaccharide pyruvyl transferase WcaK-like protein